MEATEEHWLETYLCSVLRAYSYADNGSGDTIKRIIGVRRFNPITSTDQEQRFLDAAERLFFSGMLAMRSDMWLALTTIRMATWLRPRNPSPKSGQQPSHIWHSKLHQDFWPFCFWYKPFREATRSGP